MATHKGKHITVGIGASTNKDAYEAAREAAEEAIKKCGKKPTISYVFFAGNYNPYELSKGFKEILEGTEYVGGSTDALIYNTTIINEGVLVVSIKSDYLHIGVASFEGVSKNPYSVTKKVMSEALSKIKIDKYVDPYIQFLRMKKGNIQNLIKMPSYFAVVLSRGFKQNNIGNETIIIQAISEVIGLKLPVFGGSLGVPLDTVFKGEPYEIYAFHSGKVMKDGIITMIIVSSLVYQHTLEDGCVRSKKVGYISKCENNGFVVSEISGKNAVEWYSEALGVSKKEFLSKQLYYTQSNPLGIPDDYGSFIIRSGGVPYPGNKLAYTLPFIEGNPVFIMDAGINNLLHVPSQIKEDFRYIKEKNLKPEITFAILCASRRFTLKEKAVLELKNTMKEIKGQMFGFYSFTEIGSKPGRPTKIQHLSSSIFSLYNKLVTELK